MSDFIKVIAAAVVALALQWVGIDAKPADRDRECRLAAEHCEAPERGRSAL